MDLYIFRYVCIYIYAFGFQTSTLRLNSFVSSFWVQCRDSTFLKHDSRFPKRTFTPNQVLTLEGYSKSWDTMIGEWEYMFNPPKKRKVR